MKKTPLDLSREVMRIERDDGTIVKSVQLSTDNPSPLENILSAGERSASDSPFSAVDLTLVNPTARRAAAIIAFSMARADGDCNFKEVTEIVRWFREDAGLEYQELVRLLIEITREPVSGAQLSQAVEHFVEHVPADKWPSFFNLLGHIEIADGFSHRREREFHNNLLSQLEHAVVAG